MPAILTYNSIQTSGGLHAPVVSAPVVITDGVINPLLGNYFQVAMSGDVTFSLTALPGSVTNAAFTLEIQYTSGVITWFSGIQWSNGISPIPSVGTITYTFITQDAGTTWRAIASEIYIPPAAPPAAALTLNLVGVRYDVSITSLSFPAGTAAGDLAVYFDHPNSASSGVNYGSVTPTSAGGSWTSLGGTNNTGTEAGDSSGAYMWFRVLTSGDISSGSVTGRSNTPKSVAIFRKSSGSIVTATVGVAGGLLDTGTDNPVALTCSSQNSSSIILALMLVSAGGGSPTVGVSLGGGLTSYSQYLVFDNNVANDIASLQTNGANPHAPWVIQAQGTKVDVTFIHAGGNDKSTVRNYIVVT